MTSIDNFKLLSPEVLTEPHEFWRRLRDEAPVHDVDEGIGYTVLTRYEDVSAALRDPDTFSSQLTGASQPECRPMRTARR